MTFTGASVHTLFGSTTFYGLRSLAPGATLQFQAGATTYATHMVDFQNITVNSTGNGVPSWFGYSGSSQTLRNLRVRDNNASLGSAMVARGDSVNLGNNTNWFFAVESVTDLAAAVGPYLGSVKLTWTWPQTLQAGASYYIQYSTNSSQVWLPASAQIVASTGPVSTSAAATVIVGGLDVGIDGSLADISATNYFRLWVSSSVAYSPESNGSTSTAKIPAILSTHTVFTNFGATNGWMSTFNFASRASANSRSCTRTLFTTTL